MSSETDAKVQSAKNELAGLQSKQTLLETKFNNIKELKNVLSKYITTLNTTKTPATEIVDLSQDGEEKFIRGACYCGEEIGKSEVFKNINDFFSSYNEKNNSISEELGGKISQCDSKLASLEDEINEIKGRISYLQNIISDSSSNN